MGSRGSCVGFCTQTYTHSFNQSMHETAGKLTAGEIPPAAEPVQTTHTNPPTPAPVSRQLLLHLLMPSSVFLESISASISWNEGEASLGS